jgi:hypothetical protein
MRKPGAPEGAHTHSRHKTGCWWFHHFDGLLIRVVDVRRPAKTRQGFRGTQPATGVGSMLGKLPTRKSEIGEVLPLNATGWGGIKRCELREKALNGTPICWLQISLFETWQVTLPQDRITVLLSCNSEGWKLSKCLSNLPSIPLHFSSTFPY